MCRLGTAVLTLYALNYLGCRVDQCGGVAARFGFGKLRVASR